jgi:hypothetical protein
MLTKGAPRGAAHRIDGRRLVPIQLDKRTVEVDIGGVKETGQGTDLFFLFRVPSLQALGRSTLRRGAPTPS